MEVELAHAEVVYSHYRDHQQNVPRAWVMYETLAWRHRPRVQYAKGARDELRRVARRQGPPLLIAVNHVRESDPLVLAAAGFLSPLRARIGRMRVLAKDSLFVDPVQRAKIDALGGIPVFRPKDHDIRAAVGAAQQLFHTCAVRMARGDSIAIFPEGTCNPGDPSKLQRMSSGVGHIAVQARNAGVPDLHLVTIGIAYPPEAATTGQPVVTISRPTRLTATAAPTPAAVTRVVNEELTAVVAHAHSAARAG